MNLVAFRSSIFADLCSEGGNITAAAIYALEIKARGARRISEPPAAEAAPRAGWVERGREEACYDRTLWLTRAN